MTLPLPEPVEGSLHFFLLMLSYLGTLGPGADDSGSVLWKRSALLSCAGANPWKSSSTCRAAAALLLEPTSDLRMEEAAN